MNKKVLVLILIIILAIVLFFLFSSFTGNLVLEQDDFSSVNSTHWTHMPLTYSIDESCREKTANIVKALNKIETETNNSVYFSPAENSPDINISCSKIENCYETKEERRWFWIITTEAICEHESGTAQITKMKGNKILNARITLFSIPGQEDNCSETEIHEILHIFDYQHSKVVGSIMYPEKSTKDCNENIDPGIVQDLVDKYK